MGLSLIHIVLPQVEMARGHQKIQSQQKNAEKQAKMKKSQGSDQKKAAQAALVYVCAVCKACIFVHTGSDVTVVIFMARLVQCCYKVLLLFLSFSSKCYSWIHASRYFIFSVLGGIENADPKFGLPLTLNCSGTGRERVRIYTYVTTKE